MCAEGCGSNLWLLIGAMGSEDLRGAGRAGVHMRTRIAYRAFRRGIDYETKRNFTSAAVLHDRLGVFARSGECTDYGCQLCPLGL